MPFSKPERTDLVINMTLAEVFLLLLFVVWYAQPPELGDQVPVLEAELARLKRENQILANDLRDARNEISDLKQRLDWWRREFPTIVDLELKTPPGVASKEAGRGFRRCQDDNVLIHASVIRGQVSIVWVTTSPNFSDWFSQSGRPRPNVNTRITDRNQILSILAGIRDYYQSAKENTPECRFDYRLTYETKEDYYDGRELFERYLYPAGINRTRVGLKN